ncbi:MAG: PEP-CTERM sorting domain-containing protein, partial [Candidatus Nealsonbacteria bacterium]|nr:PEP-CTERM sorting domain-containing protein [Candidatus Nealsonbacteria bacterium]
REMVNTSGVLAQIDYFTLGDGSKGFWNGMIDEALIYGKALSAAEVYALAGLEVADMTSHNVTVTASSTLDAADTPWLNLGTLTMTDGASLQTVGAPTSFTGLALAGGTTQATLNTQTATTLAAIDAGAAIGATITKSGGSTLTVMPSASTVLAATETVETTAGDLIGYHDGTNDPFGAAMLKVSGGNLVLSATTGAAGAAVDFDNAVEAIGGTIAAGPGGHAGPMTVNLAATGGVNLTGDVELTSAANYELNIAGKVTAPDTTTVNTGTVSMAGADSVLGTLTVNDGNVSVAGANTMIGTMNVAGGSAQLSGADMTVGTMTVAGGSAQLSGADLTVGTMAVGTATAPGGTVGTGGNEVNVTTRLALEEVTYEISGAAMTAMGTDLLGGADVKVAGGTLTVNPPSFFPAGSPAGAVAHWDFDEAAGLVAAEDSGLYDGDVTGDPIWQPASGQIGGALKFDGDDMVVAQLNGDKLPAYQNPPGNVISVAMWVKGAAQADKRIFSEGSSTSDRPLYNLGTDNTGNTGAFDLYVRNSENSTRANHIKSNTMVFDDTWHHIAWVDDNGTARLYVDGVADTRNFNYTRAGTSQTDRVSIGGILRATPSYFFTGLIDDVWIFDEPLTAADAQTLFAATSWPEVATTISDDTTNLTIEGDATVTSGMQEVELGNLTVAVGVANVSFDNAAWSFQNAAIVDAATINGEVAVRGTLDVGDGVGTMTVGSGELVLDNSAATATYNVQVSVAAEAGDADQIVLGGGESTLILGGELKVSSVNDRAANDFYGNAKRTIVENPDAVGNIGWLDDQTDPGNPVMVGNRFETVNPPLADPGNPADSPPHLGQGAFLHDVTYHLKDADEAQTTAVELDVFIALGGDADGDEKVWLSDWAALRANFGNTGTGKTWTEGNFDPWVDDKVWLSDWAALRANFGNASYTDPVAGAAAVPEPGTIAMLLGALAGLAVAVRRRRHAA